ncbi:asparaginase [Sphingomonas sp.]|uniref:asparaginase n=1 Tax=Sphingomonas sp. TaxID=28214 RepID=UPI0025D3B5FE|nr:asparaginase [Sphingomonas sp.]
MDANLKAGVVSAKEAPCLMILATGGTIAGRTHPMADRAYRAGEVAITQLVSAVPILADLASYRGEQISSLGSQDMGLAVWRKLVARIEAGFADPAITAILVTHGTDTIEETAFLLDLVLEPAKPVILVGAMRPSDAPSADGPGNLIDAVRVGLDPKSRSRGVLVVMNGAIHMASAVRKARTSGVDGLSSFPGGQAGIVDAGGVRFFTSPLAPAGRRHALPPAGPLPPVPIVYAHADMDPVAVERDIAGAAGIVLAGVGNGNAPDAVMSVLRLAAKAGCIVVRSTRVHQGAVDRNVEIDDNEAGFVAAGDLNPQKSRLLLQLLLLSPGLDPAIAQTAFDHA